MESLGLFLKLKDAQQDTNDDVLAIQPVTISNTLYGNGTLAKFEMAKGFTKPASGNAVS